MRFLFYSVTFVLLLTAVCLIQEGRVIIPAVLLLLAMEYFSAGK